MRQGGGGPIAARRLRILAEARERGEPFLRLDPSRLRFQLGTSHADLRVPVELSADAVALVRGAVDQLGLLLATHHARFLPKGALDPLYLREDYASLPRVLDQHSPATGGPDLRGAAHLALATHPALQGGLVTAWMGPGGKGRSLTALWIGALRNAAAEASGPAAAVQEDTPFLVALGLQAALQAAAAGLKEVLPGPPHDRWLRSAALSALWVSARTGVARFARDAGRKDDDPLVLRLEAVVNPGALAGGRGGLAGGGSTLYGPELLAGVPHAEEIATRLSSGSDPDLAIGEIVAALSDDADLSRRAEAAVSGWRLREILTAAVLDAEEGGQIGPVAELRSVLAGPGVLDRALSDDGGRQELAGRIQLALGRTAAGDGAGSLDRALRAVRAWSPREPATAVGLRREEARELYGLAAAGLLADAALERLLAPARRALSPASGAGSQDAEWEAGRLYRIATRPGPILAAAQERPIAHLFADVKDFTRRTSLLGPASMAEFLRREFYLPILAAAKARFTGMEHLADRGGVSVNNLLGDAISLSGDIEALVSLAAEIRRLLAAYETRLEREVSSDAVAGRVSSLQERYRREIARAHAARDDARGAAERAAPGSVERTESLRRAALHGAAAARLAAEMERDLSRTRGEGLEAGVFVSFGPAPLVIAIDDEAFGRNRVAIAEKINESARGTARASPARARADQQLAQAREATGNPGLRHAWSVFIGQPLSLSVPPDAAAEVLKAARAGDMTAAMRAVAKPVRRALEAAARAEDEGSGDVYNAGAALSEEALSAWLESVGAKRTVRRVELDPGDVPAEVAARHWFGAGPMSLVVTFHTDGRPAEMFRHVGRAWFRGLGEVPIWEIARDGGGPAALFQAMRVTWLDGLVA